MKTAAQIVAELYRALARGDVAAARACCSPDVRIWHNFDCKALTLEQASEGWREFCAAFRERHVVDVRCTPLPEGVLQRHLQIVRGEDGVQLAWPICIVVTVRDGLITRLDEYIDRAGFLTGDVAVTPGLDVATSGGVG